MTQDSTHGRLSRRTYVKAAGTAGAAALGGIAGCSGQPSDGGDTTTTQDGGGDQTTTTTQASGKPLEIVHWWTAGGEKDALQALLDGFKETYPEAEVTNNPAPGGAGSALDTVIKNRVLNQNPPSTFQIWPGKALHPYTEGNVLTDIGESVWGKNDMKSAYLDGVKNASKPAGNYVAVPINIHRLNNLFYNVEVVEAASIDPTTITDPADLLDALQTIAQETDYVPMAQQTQSAWSTVQLWETILKAEAGVDAFLDLAAGNPEAHEDAIKGALTRVKEYSTYFNSDAGSISWDQANSKVVNGEAAFIHQGDWAAGQYRAAESFEYGEQWDHVAFPGTKSMYSLVMDSFVFPKHNPSPETTEKFLTYCGSVDAQERFNPIKGSIPPRTDVPSDEFGPFLTAQMDSFKNSKRQPPTIAHGTAVVPGVKSSIETAFAGFIEQWDVNQTYQGIVNAFN